MRHPQNNSREPLFRVARRFEKPAFVLPSPPGAVADMSRYDYYEFFAGGGMARAGLGAGWNCLFANDFDAMKVATYSANWGSDHILCEDVAKLSPSQLPGSADLAWASFPCQDLSLAGDCAGLGRAASTARTRSGTFWPFWSLMKALEKEARAPRLIVLENVHGALTSNGGRDFAAIGKALSASKYNFGAVVVDAGYHSGGVGDIELAPVIDRAAAYTPVPGGVGPMTIATLIAQTVEAAEKAAEIERLVAASSQS